MLDHLRNVPEEHARFQRFFTLNHLHNDPSVTESELRLARAAVAKVLNSLSWRRAIVQPRPIDEQQTILAFDLPSWTGTSVINGAKSCAATPASTPRRSRPASAIFMP